MTANRSVPAESATSDLPTETDLGRRQLLRGGAVLAGAAGAVAWSAVAARPAQAADGQAVLQGRTNEATSTTTLRIGSTNGNPDAPTLALRNADGPSLELQPLAADWNGPLNRGQIANTDIGPNIGLVDPEGNDAQAFLATEFDLLALPVLEAQTPERIVDTRNSTLRGNIVATPANSFDSAGRLLAGRTMSLALAPADASFTINAAFLNVTTTASTASGYFSVFPPGPRPTASTLNFVTGQTLANGTFVGVAALDGTLAFSVYTNATSHVIIDVLGVITEAVPGPEAASRRGAPGYRRPRAARRLPKRLGRKR